MSIGNYVCPRKLTLLELFSTETSVITSIRGVVSSVISEVTVEDGVGLGT